jgi:hypothetical protein
MAMADTRSDSTLGLPEDVFQIRVSSEDVIVTWPGPAGVVETKNSTRREPIVRTLGRV